MLRRLIGNKTETILSKIARILLKIKISPNILTLAGLCTNIFAAYFFYKGLFPSAGVLVVFAGLFDMLDGAVARAGDSETKFGAFLDSVVDRYSDFLLFGGLLAYFSKEGDLKYTLVLLVILSGSLLTSYVRARAELFIEKCAVGLMERAERIILLAAGAIFGFIDLALWLLAVLTHLTAFYRIWYTYRTNRSNP
jgi:CDP-diacylglycerol--glycerol-3-phosphate 3-phosphatidyltransferase